MKALFHPASVVVIGASDSQTNLGKEIVRNLLEFKYQGKLYLVGNEGGVLYGRPVCQSLDDVDSPVDLAVILTPAKTVPGIMHQCGQKGIKRLIIESGGFGESGEEGGHLGEELVDIAKQYDMRFIGPNCIGIINSLNGLATPFAPLRGLFPRGNVGIISQSGGVALWLLYMFDGEHLGISKFATVGNKLSIGENDLLEYYMDDPQTEIICIYLESIEDGRRFIETAKRSTKPILVHKANTGSLSSVIAQSHTEAVVNDDSVVDAALRQAGMVRFTDFLDCMDFVKVMQLPAMKGKNLAIVSRSGGHAVIGADAAHAHGFDLPPFNKAFVQAIGQHFRAKVIKVGNPLDLGDLYDFDVYLRIMEDLIRESTIDGILFLHTYLRGTESEPSRRLLQSLSDLSRECGKPVAVCLCTDHRELVRFREEIDLPCFTTPERALKALGGAIAYERRRAAISTSGRALKRPPDMDVQSIQSVIGRCLAEGRSPLLHESLHIIEAAGVPIPSHTVVTDPEVDTKPSTIPIPYAAKIISDEVSHKSDTGGVILGLTGPEQLRRACAQLFELFRPSARGVLVQTMVPRKPGSYELIIGGKRDPHFGPMVMLGHGGVFVETFGKVSLRMAPVSEGDVDEMIEELPGSELIEGVRGLKPIDREELKESVVRVSALMTRFPEIHTMEINPAIVSADGIQAVDARIFLG